MPLGVMPTFYSSGSGPKMGALVSSITERCLHVLGGQTEVLAYLFRVVPLVSDKLFCRRENGLDNSGKPD